MFDPTFHATALVLIQVTALLIVAYLLYAAHQRKLARKHELSKQILDKLSSEEFLEVLQSPDGRRSIERLLGSYESPEAWVRNAIRRAILLVFAGVALITAYAQTDFSGHELLLVLGSLSAALGLGYLVGAALTRARAGRENADPAT